VGRRGLMLPSSRAYDAEDAAAAECCCWGGRGPAGAAARRGLHVPHAVVEALEQVMRSQELHRCSFNLPPNHPIPTGEITTQHSKLNKQAREISEFDIQFARLIKIDTQFASFVEFNTVHANSLILGVSLPFSPFSLFSLLFLFSGSREKMLLPLAISVQVNGSPLVLEILLALSL
jgi:hypothetical protein